MGYDPRFDEAEAEVDYGTPWRYKGDGSEDCPNPLTVIVTGWSTGVTSLGEAEFMTGNDREGKKWSVLVGNTQLKKELIEGIVEKWDDDSSSFLQVDVLGRVAEGDVVSIKYKEDKETKPDAEGKKYTYPVFQISRKALTDEQRAAAEKKPEPAAEPDTEPKHDPETADLPF